jgi:AraC-like DNA-binding protein
MKTGSERIYHSKNLKVIHQNVPKKHLSAHQHEEAHLFIPLEGTVQVRMHDKIFTIPAGQMLFISGSVEHSFYAHNKSGERLILQFREDAKRFKPFKSKAVLLPLNQLMKTLCFNLFPSVQMAFAAHMEELLLEILAASLQAQVQGGENAMFATQEKILGTAQPMLKQLFILMEEELDLSMETMAKKVGTSSRSLTRLVKTELGLSPKDLYTFFRVRKACEMIHEGRFGLTAIAYECGYASLSQFITNFKKWTGQKPSEFRASQ